ncbi:MAG TPA: glycosyl transferase [Bacillus bacterium]|uniref:glycosyltransferase n=1 Tax=Siminovitchia fordii TaxID=254759 RepID=UPI000373A684|nr:glycosyltransferase [Siminovitchia fordii]HBZ09957.1 glycosyl transferase [Bacillus sp. (in: firmicutes)]
MKKKVCMFVWNHFTNDARVLRECTALSTNGYKVDLICIHDPSEKGLPRFEERNSHFHVYRVRRYPVVWELFQKVIRLVREDKIMLIPLLVLVGVLLIYAPYIPIILFCLLVLLMQKTIRALWLRGSIFLRMICHGFKKDYDIYHSNDLNTLPQGYICAKWRFRKKKLVYDSHEVQTSRTGYDSALYGKMEGFFIRKISAMIVENHTRAKYSENLYGFYPNVVHNYPFKEIGQSAEKAPLHEQLGLPKGEKILLYQGGIQTGRGLDKLIKAAPLFKEGTLVLIGDGRIKPDLIQLVKDMNLEEKVKFLPKVPLKELPKHTRNAYLGFQVLNNVCFNHYSASSNKLFEYLMAGVPVVACDFPEIKRIVEGEQVGLCIDSHSEIEIAGAVNKLLENKALYRQLANNCAGAKHKYNWEQEQRNFLSVYDYLIAN